MLCSLRNRCVIYTAVVLSTQPLRVFLRWGTTHRPERSFLLPATSILGRSNTRAGLYSVAVVLTRSNSRIYAGTHNVITLLATVEPGSWSPAYDDDNSPLVVRQYGAGLPDLVLASSLVSKYARVCWHENADTFFLPCTSTYHLKFYFIYI